MRLSSARGVSLLLQVAYYVGVQLGIKVATKPAAIAEEATQGVPESTQARRDAQQQAQGRAAASSQERTHVEEGATQPSTSAAHPASLKLASLQLEGDHQARARPEGELQPPPQIKFSDKLYYSGVTGAVRVACRSMGSHGLRRCSIDQTSSFGLRKSVSHDLYRNGRAVPGRRSEGGGQHHPSLRPRMSVDWVGQQALHPLLKE